MYIAFKWLFFLASTMWLAMCIFDIFIKENIRSKTDGQHYERIFKNISIYTVDTVPTRGTVDHSNHSNYKGQSIAYLHFIMFLAGALAVTTYNKKQNLISYTQKKMANIYLNKLPNLKITTIEVIVAISRNVPYVLAKIKIISNKMINKINCLKVSSTVKQNSIRVVLLNKIKQMSVERKSLGQLLISAIHENKNIRLQYQLQTMTKNRLMQHIEDTQKQIKENRSRYVSFQQLYLVTHQENVFLKARLKKMKQEKDEAEKNLMSLIHEVYRSKNKDLRSYCSRFIVKSKDKLINLDVKAEINEFLDKSSELTNNSNSPTQSKDQPRWPETGMRITEVLNEDDCLVPVVSDVPRLKGLPGEYVWTVKDKNGIIEKLYEYDVESDLDNGETLRRIRHYTVYYDKDCLLDFSKMNRENYTETSSFCSQPITLNNPLSNQRFLTGSQAFQNFLHSHNSIVPLKTT